MSAKRITEDKMRASFTMTPEELDSAVNIKTEQLTYDAALDILENIIDNATLPPAANGIERIAWVVRSAFLLGYREAATIFNEAAIMGVQEFFAEGKTA